MSTASSSILSVENRPLAFRARPDLTYQRQTYHGQTWWVVKDPLSLKYFRFREEACTVLRMLNGKTSLSDLKTEIEERFPPTKLTYQELHSMLASLHQSGLVLAEAAGQGGELYQRHAKQFRRRTLGQLSSILWIRLPGVDPERFLSWLHPKAGWFFSRWFFFVWALLAITAGLLVIVHFNEFYAKLPGFYQFFSAENAVWMMAAMAFAKIMHELGHGLACKHFGGECHEIGVMLLVMTPCLYCDTSDSWVLPNKWYRAAIGAAGMYVEVFLASLCTIIWWNTAPGLLHYLCLNIMFVSSVSAVMFNGNPLLRYDGYYILADILEIPNLSQKSRTALIGLLRYWCLGMPWKTGVGLPERRRELFALYALASACYRWFVVVAILWFLSEVFEPYGLQPIAHVLIAVTLIGLIAVPVFNVVKFFRVPGRTRQVNKSNLLVTAIVVLLLGLAIFTAPLPHRVMTSAIIEPGDADRIYISLPGALEVLDVEEGKPVESGSQLAVLRNPDIDLQINRLSGEQDRLRKRLQALRRRQGTDRSAAEQIPHTIEELKALDERLDQLREDQQRLTLTANSSGVVMPAPQASNNDLGSGGVQEQFATPLDEINRNSWLETGTLFCLVGNPEKMDAVLVVDQANIEFVRKGQRVDIKLDEYPTETWTGVIEEIAANELQVAPRPLSNKVGGSLSTETDKTGSERPARAAYQARVKLENEDQRLSPGFRGRAKVHVGSRTIAQAVSRYFSQTGK